MPLLSSESLAQAILEANPALVMINPLHDIFHCLVPPIQLKAVP